ALELNLYRTPSDFKGKCSDIETEQVEVVKEVIKKTSIPVSVKLSIYYTNPLGFIAHLDNHEVNGFVLFNRFFQPEIDPDKQENIFQFNFSSETDNRLPLRYAGLLYDNIKGDICTSTGIMTGKDVAKMVLAGARCVQVVSTLFINGLPHIQTMVKELQGWMEHNGYTDLDSFRGKLSRKNSSDPWRYTRSQYVRLLLHPDQIINNFPSM
ncbi:MAG: dihydroorotate dehydrogenase, partial [Spirochaetota bacterium]